MLILILLNNKTDAKLCTRGIRVTIKFFFINMNYVYHVFCLYVCGSIGTHEDISLQEPIHVDTRDQTQVIGLLANILA